MPPTVRPHPYPPRSPVLLASLYNAHTVKDMKRRHYSKSSRGFTIVELMYTLTVMLILGLMTIPTFAGEVSSSQRDANEVMLIHMNQDAQTLANLNGESAPSYNDYVNAAAEVYYTNAANQTLPLNPTSANSITLGTVSITVSSPGPSEVVGLAMVSAQPGVSVYLESTGVAGAAPAVWACSNVSASSALAASSPLACS